MVSSLFVSFGACMEVFLEPRVGSPWAPQAPLGPRRRSSWALVGGRRGRPSRGHVGTWGPRWGFTVGLRWGPPRAPQARWGLVGGHNGPSLGGPSKGLLGASLGVTVGAPSPLGHGLKDCTGAPLNMQKQASARAIELPSLPCALLPTGAGGQHMHIGTSSIVRWIRVFSQKGAKK